MAEDVKISIKNRDALFVFGNKAAGFWMGAISDSNQHPFLGWTNYEYRYIRNISWKTIPSAEVQEFHLFPDHTLKVCDQFLEEFYFIDLFDAAVTIFTPKKPLESAILRIELAGKPGMVLVQGNKLVLDFPDTRFPQPRYAVISLNVPFNENYTLEGKLLSIEVAPVSKIQLVVVLEHSVGAGIDLAEQIQANHGRFLNLRKQRMEALWRDNSFRTSDENLYKAYVFSLVAMDDLISYQGGPGIFAGYPWFNNYWGRDTFISLTGALLVTGRWKKAREILLHFAQSQYHSPGSSLDGRIPNRIQLNDTIYNTADGTPWYFYALQRYVDYSGDVSVMDSLYPVLKHFIQATIRSAVDSLGFIRHEDAESWMDAKDAKGAWSPRGDRAVEIQALWLKNLEMGIYWSKIFGEIEQSRQWENFYRKAKSNFFANYSWKEKQILYDHLNPDGTPDQKIRPNMIIAAHILDGEMPANLEDGILSTAINELTYPYGVATLPQWDPDFHPYHHYPPFYVPDEAYHNGLIWVWLNGMLKSCLGKAGLWPHYFTLLQEEMEQVQFTDGIGTLSELLEPVPRDGEQTVRYSGTISQAWSLAEFIRSFHEDFIGIRPVFLHPDTVEILVKPVPTKFLPLEKVIRVGENEYRVLQLGNNRKQIADIVLRGPEKVWLKVMVYGPEKLYYQRIYSSDKSHIRVEFDGNGNPMLPEGESWNTIPLPLSGKQLSFVQPDKNRKWPVIHHRMKYELIPSSVIHRTPQSEIIYTIVEDQPGEKSGYLYPSHPAFVKGIADIQQAKIFMDRQFVRFEIQMKKLTDPGWRPESGFQLTILAIAIDTDATAAAEVERLPFGMDVDLPRPTKVHRWILVGNGIDIYDENLQKKASFIPMKKDDGFGDPVSGKIAFTLPLKWFDGDPNHWKLIIFSGLQDDHGGGGIGSFRMVKEQPSEWTGGGRNPKFGNIYDYLSNWDFEL